MSGGREGHTNLSGSAPWVLSAAKRTQPGTPSNDPTQRATRNWNNGSQPNGITLPFLATRLRPAAPSTQGQAGTPPMCRPRARLRGPLGKTPLSLRNSQRPSPCSELQLPLPITCGGRTSHRSPGQRGQRAQRAHGEPRMSQCRGPAGASPRPRASRLWHSGCVCCHTASPGSLSFSTGPGQPRPRTRKSGANSCARPHCPAGAREL